MTKLTLKFVSLFENCAPCVTLKCLRHSFSTLKLRPTSCYAYLWMNYILRIVLLLLASYLLKLVKSLWWIQSSQSDHQYDGSIYTNSGYNTRNRSFFTKHHNVLLHYITIENNHWESRFVRFNEFYNKGFEKNKYSRIYSQNLRVDCCLLKLDFCKQTPKI